MKKILFVIMVAVLILPNTVLGASCTYDLGISGNDISFSKNLVAYQKVRIYATIHNYGSEDTSGYVTFYQGDLLIGDSQVVSVRANGLADEVYVDWDVPSGSFNIRAQINGQKPKDENAENDLAISQLFVPLPDNDRDGISDEEDDDDDNDGVKDVNEPILGTDPFQTDTDNDGCWDGQDDFPVDPHECIDTDGDGIGDNSDSDDDNDGLSDGQENNLGTDPKKADTDGDGVIDSQDDYPLDSSRTTRLAAVQPKTGINTNNADSASATNLNTPLISPELINVNINLDSSGALPVNLNGSINLDLIKTTGLNPQVGIGLVEKSWNTFIFTPELKGLLEQNLTYRWDLGDGTISTDKIIEHTYSGSGSYQIKLDISGKNDLTMSSNKDLRISFFHAANNKLWLIIGVLMLILLGLVGLAMSSLKRRYV